jgi:drug/metabolite transporter (DMT)-like permease
VNTPSRGAVITVFAAVYIIWGSTYLGIKWAIDSIPPLLMVTGRFLSAGAILYGWARWRGAPRPTADAWRRAALVGLCLLVFGNGGLTFGEMYVPTGLASLLIALVPLYMALMGWFSGQSPRPTPRIWFGLACGLAGVAFLARPDAAVPMHPRFFVGVAIILFSGLIWSVGSLYSRHAGRGIDPTLMAGMQMLAAGTMLFPGALIRGEHIGFSLAQVTLKSGLSFLYLVTMGAIVGYSAYLWLLRHCPPSQVSTYAYVNPVVAVLLGVGLAGEKFTSSMLVGATLILVAVVLVITKRSPQAARSSAVPLSEANQQSAAQ